VKELEMLRRHKIAWHNLELADGQTMTLEGVAGESCEVEITIEQGRTTRSARSGRSPTMAVADEDDPERTIGSAHPPASARHE
jgi:hypothetical protein